jgi:nitrogen fixation protein NifQ
VTKPVVQTEGAEYPEIAPWTPLQGKDTAAAGLGIATYRMLTRHDPSDLWTVDDHCFDAHVFASILAVAATEGGRVASQAGLTASDLNLLLLRRFPQAAALAPAWYPISAPEDADEIALVRDLLLRHRSTEGEDGRLLAAMVARRGMEPSHLWEDLGLRDRTELTRLLERHFAPLAADNTRNMRWKRYFYRMLCEAEGFTLCSTPVCSDCTDFDMCFGEETGESRLAIARRAHDLDGAD